MKKAIILALLFVTCTSFSMFKDHRIKKYKEEIQLNQCKIDKIAKRKTAVATNITATAISMAAPLIAQKATDLIMGEEDTQKVRDFKERHPFIYASVMFIASAATETLLEKFLGIK